MEFHNLGSHCSNPSCKQLDFLPFKCDACGLQFCLEHRTYENHHCAVFQDHNITDICSECKLELDPNQEHICKGKKKRSNKCQKPKCKKIELIPIFCAQCNKQFCIQHRLEVDHDCIGKDITKSIIVQSRKQNPKEKKTSLIQKNFPVQPQTKSSIITNQNNLVLNPTVTTTTTNILIRLSNGEVIRQVFHVNDTLSTVKKFIDQSRNDGTDEYTLRMTFPSRELHNEDFTKTLTQLDLVPSGTLILKRCYLTPTTTISSGGQDDIISKFKNFLNSFFW